MNQVMTPAAEPEFPLPETQRELELLLEALHALNEALDHYEAEIVSPQGMAENAQA